MDPQQTEQLIDAPGVPTMCIRTGVDGSQELEDVRNFQQQHANFEQHPEWVNVLRPLFLWSETRRQQRLRADSSTTFVWRNWFAPEMPYQDVTTETYIPDFARQVEKQQLIALRIDPFHQTASRVAVPVDVCSKSDEVIMTPQNAAMRVLLGLDIMSRTHARPYESASHSEGQLQIYYAWSSSKIKQGNAMIPGWCLPSSSYNAMKHMLGVALIFQRKVFRLPTGKKIDLLHDCSQSSADAFLTRLQFLPVLSDRAYGHDTFPITCEQCKRVDVFGCGRCLMAMYCSTECQRKDWPQHKSECKALRKALKTS